MIHRIFTIIIIILFSTIYLQAERIVTLAPALTEIVYELGKGDSLVGNTNYCNYPSKAKYIKRVGGMLDINLEILVSLKPDFIIFYSEMYEKIKFMKDKSKLVVVKHTNLKDIYDGIEIIAKALHLESKGKELIGFMKSELRNLQKEAERKSTQKSKVLLIIGRSRDNLSNMYIIGAKDFLNELLGYAGGINAYQGNIDYPSVSIESIVSMNPQVIIELSAFNEGIEDQKILDQWKKFPFISAVKNNRIKIVRDSMWVIPGPRVPQIARQMFSFIY